MRPGGQFGAGFDSSGYGIHDDEEMDDAGSAEGSAQRQQIMDAALKHVVRGQQREIECLPDWAVKQAERIGVKLSTLGACKPGCIGGVRRLARLQMKALGWFW